MEKWLALEMLVCPPPQLLFSCSSQLGPNGCIHCFVLYNDLTQVTSQIMAKMVRRRCAFCPEGEECSIMYISEEQNLAVHQDCLVGVLIYQQCEVQK